MSRNSTRDLPPVRDLFSDVGALLTDEAHAALIVDWAPAQWPLTEDNMSDITDLMGSMEGFWVADRLWVLPLTREQWEAGRTLHSLRATLAKWMDPPDVWGADPSTAGWILHRYGSLIGGRA